MDNPPFILFLKTHYFDFLSWFTYLHVHGSTLKYVLNNAFLSAYLDFSVEVTPIVEKSWKGGTLWNKCYGDLSAITSQVICCTLVTSRFWTAETSLIIPYPIWLKLSLIKLNIPIIWIRITSHEGCGSLKVKRALRLATFEL